MEFKEIPIDKIKRIENVRLRTEDIDTESLMRDIKQRGLLHPVGVWKKEGEYILLYGNRRLEACQKLGWQTIPAKIRLKKDFDTKEFLSENIAENIHRVNISPVEEGRMCNFFHEQGMSYGEVAAMLNVPKGRVENLIGIYQRVPDEHRKIVVNVPPSSVRNKKGLSVTTTNQILRLRLPKEDTKELFFEARQRNFSGSTIRLIGLLMGLGLKLSEAINEKDNWEIRGIELIVRKSKLKKIKSFTRLVRNTLTGRRPADKDLVFDKETEN